MNEQATRKDQIMNTYYIFASGSRGPEGDPTAFVLMSKDDVPTESIDSHELVEEFQAATWEAAKTYFRLRYTDDLVITSVERVADSTEGWEAVVSTTPLPFDQVCEKELIASRPQSGFKGERMEDTNTQFAKDLRQPVKATRKVKVTAKVVYEGEVSDGAEEGIIMCLANHLRKTPLRIRDTAGDVLELDYQGRGKFTVELELPTNDE